MSNATHFDVWFDDDGRWRLDEARVTRAEAEQIVAELKASGYRTHVTPHNPDEGTTDTRAFPR